MRKIILLGMLVLFSSVVFANTYVVDMNFVTSDTVYTINKSIQLKGYLYISNYTANNETVSNHTGLANASINFSLINKNTNISFSSYNIITTTDGEFYSQSTYHSSATAITAPSTAGSYYIRATYTDPNSQAWWTESEIQVVNQTLDRLGVSPDRLSYDPSQSMTITAEAIREIGDSIAYTANVSINGSIRNSTSKTVISSFNCTTNETGKCSASVTAPDTYGEYIIEINNFKAFGYFEVSRFAVNIEMRDEQGQSVKHTFNTGEQASVVVAALTNSTSESYSFSGEIISSTGSLVKSVTATTLNTTNTYTNRYTFTLDAINFQAGTYIVNVNVTKSGDGTVSTSTAFEVKSWDLSVKKKEVSSGFEYEYSAFANTTVTMEIYPTWRSNASVISDVNTTSSVNISLVDDMYNVIGASNATWNSSCGTEGCYRFSFSTPAQAGSYMLMVTVAYSGHSQTTIKRINIISTTIFAQTSDKDGNLKELFGAKDFVYISLSGKNTTSTTNLTSATVISVVYMNGTEYAYTQVSNSSQVNSTNSDLEWAWNQTSHMLKLDTPSAGGMYTIYITAENNTAATSTKFIVNPYDVCLVAKNTAGQVTSGYYYVQQFKTSDTIYFELKVYQANNPTGRATFENATNGSSYGIGSACSDLSASKQVINNATITIESVTNRETGKSFSLNTTESTCKSDSNKGAYTCTVKGLQNWDGGGYGIKFKIVSQDGETSDVAFGGFEARSFYLYAWANTWMNKPNSTIPLNIYMYEAGNNWWGNVGSGGLSGTVTLQKIEYQGRPGEWLMTPISYNYTTSSINTSTITNGQGTMTLPANLSSSGEWKTGSYRAMLKGTDSAGNTDYGYAWFDIRKWEVYASPVECSGSSCTSTYNINSRSNITLYVTINNAGEWGMSGNSLGGNVTISIKKIQDCRKWPCTDLNSTSFNATNITVSTSSGWYWGTINTNYTINITPTSGSWGTGYWQVTLDINGSETGNGWFNTIAFYVESQSTDSSGTTWKYNIKNNESMYFKIISARSQKGGWYSSSYTSSDYINTTINSATLQTWNSITNQQIQYNYPTHFNISIVGGGTTINGTRIINVTFNNGSWPSGYYWGELTLKNSNNETATSWMSFQAKPFRVEASTSSYTIDDNACTNGTIRIYDPDWSSYTVINGTYNITSITESIWNGYGNTITTYTNYTPISTFNGSSNITICPTDGTWPSGSWGNYHYLTVLVSDSNGNSETGWMSFRTVPFTTSWGNIVGGTSVFKTNNITVPVTVTRASSGAATTGNLSRIYQWRYDNYNNRLETYNFSVGSCDTRNGVANCMINGTQNITIYSPDGGWKDGYNYLQADWISTTNASITIQDWSGIWFNAMDVYNGWYNNVNVNGQYQYYFSLDSNLSIQIIVRDTNWAAVAVNVSSVEYSTPSTTCWNDYCRTYNAATFSIVGQSNYTLSNGTGIIRIIKPAANWTKGYIYIKANVTGANGTVTIKNGNLYVKDLTSPNISVSAPTVGQIVNSSTFWINWTTTEIATCDVLVQDYNSFYNWYCTNDWYNISTSQYCNNTRYSGSSYLYDYIGATYRSWSTSNTWGWSSGSTDLSTGGTTHYYNYRINNLTNQTYGIRIYCSDEDWNYVYGWSIINITNMSTSSSTTTAVSLNLSYPSNNAQINSTSLTLNYSLAGANSTCYLYTNYTSSWAQNQSQNATIGNNYFNLSIATNGTYLWSVYCIDRSNSSNVAWASSNRTFIINYTNSSASSITVTLSSPSNASTSSSSSITFTYNFTGVSLANCSLYGNFTGSWALNQTTVSALSGQNTFSLNLSNNVYIWNVYCSASSATGWASANYTLTVNASSSPQNITAVSLTYPSDSAQINSTSLTLNFTLYNASAANCSLYGNFTGSWAYNQSRNVSEGSHYFNLSIASNGTYIWNIYCVNSTNSSNTAWASSNRSFIVSVTTPTESINWPMFGRTANSTRHYPDSLNISNSNVSLLWSYNTSGLIDSTPAVADNVVYIGAGSKVYALNASTGTHLWNYTTGSLVDSGIAIINGRVYFNSDDNKLYVLNASTGTHLWNYTTGNSIYSSPIILDDVLYIGGGDNGVYAFNATNGSVLWRYALPSTVDFSTPAISNGIVYIGCGNNKTYALNASTGTHIWNYTAFGPMMSSPAIANDIVYIGSQDNIKSAFYALNATTGSQIWNSSSIASAIYYSSPAIRNGVVYVGSWDQSLHAINASTGVELWQNSTGAASDSSPALANNAVIIGSNDFKIYAFSLSDGRKLWNYTTSGIVFSAPVISNGIIYAGSEDQKVYALVPS